MRAALVVGSVMLVCLMMFFPPVGYCSGSSIGPNGYYLKPLTLLFELIATAMTTAFFLTFRSRR